MPHLVALALIVALLLVTLAAGVWLRRRGGRVSLAGSEDVINPGDFGLTRFGAAGSIVQFSTAYCSRCPGVRRQIAELVHDRDAVSFAHVDVTDDPGLAARYRLLQTPTVLLIDAHGRQRARLSGPLSRSDIDTAITRLSERSS